MTRWLDRRIAAPGPCLTLCLAPDELSEALRRIKYTGPAVAWVVPGKHAVVHTLCARNNSRHYLQVWMLAKLQQ